MFSLCRRVPRRVLPGCRHNHVSNKPQPPRVIFSGIQPTGIPHLGNFLGAILSWVRLQRTAQPDDLLYFCTVGWHALTLPQDPVELRNNRRDMLAILLASGLDPKRSVIFHQDENQDHVELAWILNCFAPVGKLRRMTSWKTRLADSRNANSEDEIDDSMLNSGLLTYPVLQAADVLAYKATHIPVGEDQTQHLELARDLRDVLNRVCSDKHLFPAPKQLITRSPRVLSLLSPAPPARPVKMSKSAANPNSRILLTDTPDQIQKKFRSAVTDSYLPMIFDPVERPGVANMLTILAECENFTKGDEANQVDEHDIVKRYEGLGHGALKNDVTEAVIELLRRPREEFEKLKNNGDEWIDQVARDGARRAKERTSPVLAQVRSKLGLA
ncbi:hypothetical protein DL96DRAFT_1305744 [Flagelloscypha sp. PMI_526]|nr:hypothetical protein DL96DRAFT_1305744 [Flagelloscypha sp. PMI_526]